MGEGGVGISIIYIINQGAIAVGDKIGLPKLQSYADSGPRLSFALGRLPKSLAEHVEVLTAERPGPVSTTSNFK